jgi:hypothetical protein
MGVVARRMAGVPGRVPELRRFAAEPEDAANCLFEGGNPPFRRRRTHMHQTSLRAVRLVGVSAAILIISCGLALARPGGHGGGSHGGGHHGGHGAGLSHGGAMHQRGHSGHHATANKSHNKHLADKHRGNDGTPAGFGHGNASWKQNGGTPPGWSHGNKTGWGCTPGRAHCMPPGLAKKQGNGGHTAKASRSRMTPISYRRAQTRTHSRPRHAYHSAD